MNKKMFILFITLSCSIYIYANENAGKVLKPEGKLSFKSVFKVADESGNEFGFYRNAFSGNLSPDFLYAFTRSEKNAVDYTEYHRYNNLFISFLSLGITWGSGGIAFFATLPLYIIPSLSVVGVALGAVFGGIFIAASIVCFIVSSVFYKKAKNKLQEMIEEYNLSADSNAVSVNDTMQFDVFKYAF